MEPKFQTSFIPKKPVSGESERVRAVHDLNIFSLIATIVFISTVLLFGGLFFYKSLLIKQITKAGEDVNAARSAIQPATINELIDNNSRISTSVGLLEKHVVTSKLLLLLSDLAVKKLHFNDFSYSSKSGGPTVKIRGEVLTYNAMAKQYEIFNNSPYLKNMSFSDISLTENGNIKFQISSSVDSGLLSYKKSLESEVVEVTEEQ